MLIGPPRNEKDSRNLTGKSYQGSVSNLSKDRNTTKAFSVDRIPTEIRSGSLEHQVRREDTVRRRNDYRSGYYHYNPNWCDDWFWSSCYTFDPFRTRCVASPWYYYPSLPGYIRHSNVIVISFGNIIQWRGSSYRYYPVRNDSGYGRNDRYNRSELDYAIDDLVYAFEEQDRRSLGRLIPTRGRVDIYLEGEYDYSLESRDFYDLMLDAIYNTQTRRYEIVSVQTNSDEAEVVARHEYTDPWGRRSSVYHWYRLEEDRRGYVITKFGTSNNRW
jgi:hypothetical protein